MNPAKNRILLSRVLVAAIVVFYLLGASAWSGGGGLVGGLLFLAGTVLVGLGVAGRAWCLGYISGRKSRALVMEGPYSMCRNPLYLFSFIGAVGVGLCSQTWTIPAIAMAMFIAYYPFAIVEEEKRLKENFPSEWEEYSGKVPRLVPSFSSFEEATEITVSAKEFRKGVFDLMYFVVIIGGFEIIEVLHEAGYLPVFYLIY